MKKIILILLLLPNIVFSQMTVSRYPTTCCFTGGVASFSGVTYNVGTLYIMFVGTSNSSGSGAAATISLSGTGQTWDELYASGGIVNGGSLKRIQAFRYAPTSTNSNTVSFSIGGTGNQDGMWFELIVITGADLSGTNGASAITSNAAGSANSADPSLTLTTITATHNAVIAGFINSVNAFTGTPESGWTEIQDNGFSVPDTGDYIMSRINTTDNTPTVTAASGNWAGIAIEIKASGRRIISIN